MHKITNVIGMRQPSAQIRINILIHLSNMGANIYIFAPMLDKYELSLIHI